jgi:hypothetical protein
MKALNVFRIAKQVRRVKRRERRLIHVLKRLQKTESLRELTGEEKALVRFVGDATARCHSLLRAAKYYCAANNIGGVAQKDARNPQHRRTEVFKKAVSDLAMAS